MGAFDNNFIASYNQNKALRDNAGNDSDNWLGYASNMGSSIGGAALSGVQGVAGVLGTSLQMAQSPDTSIYYNQLDQAGMFRDGKTWDINQLMEQRNSIAPIHTTYEDIGGISDLGIAGGTLSAGAQGAMTGLQIGGPWGALIGGVIGTGAGLAGGLIGRSKAKAQVDAINMANKYQQEQNDLYFNLQADKIQDYQFGKLFANRAAEGGGIHIKKENKGKFTAAAKRNHMSVQEFAKHVLSAKNKDKYSATMRKRANFARNAAGWSHAEGGQIETISDMTKFNTHGGYYAPNNLVRINTGGTHEQNTNGGVQIGMDAQGIPNLVEQEENIYNDYVFSNRIKASKAQLKHFGLPEKYEGLTMTTIADKLSEEARQRPNDAVSSNGMGAMLDRLIACQEDIKEKREQARVRRQLNSMSPEELMALGTEMSQAQQPMLQDQMAIQQAQPMVEAPMLPQEAMPIEQTPMQPTMMAAYGGNIYRPGGVLRGVRRGTNVVRIGRDLGKQADDDQTQFQKWANGIADVADLVGMTEIPVVDPIANGVGALGHAVAGDWVGAGLSAASAVPLLGKFADAAKVGKTGYKAGSKAAKLASKVESAKTGVKAAEEATEATSKAVRYGKTPEEAAKLASKKYDSKIEELGKIKAEQSAALGRAKGKVTTIEKAGERATTAGDYTKAEGQISKLTNAEKEASAMQKKYDKSQKALEKAEHQKARYQARLEGRNIDKTGQQLAGYLLNPVYLGQNAPALMNKVASKGAVGRWVAPAIPSVLGAGQLGLYGTLGSGIYDWGKGEVNSGNDISNPADEEALINRHLEADGGPIARTYERAGWLNRGPWKYILNREKDITGNVGIAQQGAIANGTRTPFVYIPEGSDNSQVYTYNTDFIPPVFSTYSFDGSLIGPEPVKDSTTASTRKSTGTKKTAAVKRNVVEALPVVNRPLSPALPLTFTDKDGRVYTLSSGDNKLGYSLSAQPVDRILTVEDNEMRMNPELASVPVTTQEVAAAVSDSAPANKNAALSTIGRYAPFIDDAAKLIYGATNPPIPLVTPNLTPTFVNGRLALARQRYNPIDQQSMVNPVLANSSAGYRAINNSGMGPSTSAAMVAAMNAANAGIGAATTQGRIYNDQLRSGVTQQNNAASQAEADFYRNINATNAGIANSVAAQRAQLQARYDMLNDYNDTQWRQGLGELSGNMAKNASRWGWENANRNAVNSNTALLGYQTGANNWAYYNRPNMVTAAQEENVPYWQMQLPEYQVALPGNVIVLTPEQQNRQKQIQEEIDARLLALKKKHGLA